MTSTDDGWDSFLKIDDVKLTCYGQKIIDYETGNTKKIELLTRVSGAESGTSIEKLFNSLTPDQHLSIIHWQYEIATCISDILDIEVCLNVDNRIFLEPKHYRRLCRVLNDNDMRLTLEFTEMHPMPEVNLVHRIFRQLRERNVRVALDDFGTGFNGMSLFVDYDFDIVKIDRALVMNVSAGTKKTEILSLLADMISTLGKSHVVEGVETEDQARVLSSIGYRQFQGFLFHRPESIRSVLLDCHDIHEMGCTHDVSCIH